MSFARWISAAVVVSSFAVGCSSEKPSDDLPFEVNPEAQLAPRDVSDSAVVEDGKVTLPRTKANVEWAAKLHQGSIIAGNVDTTHAVEQSKNKSGFLRKVARIQDADPIVIETTPAALDELVQGEIAFGRAAPSIFQDAPRSQKGTQSETLRTLDEEPDKQGSGAGKGEKKKGTIDSKSSGGIEFSQEVSNVSFGIDTEVDGEIAIKRGKWIPIPTGINKARAKLKVVPSFEFDLVVKGKLTQEQELSLPGPSLEVVFTAGTIPVTLQLTPKVSCKIAGGVDASLKGHVKTAAGVATGFEYTSGSFKPIFEPELKAEFETKELTIRALLEAKCEAGLSAKLKAFDAVGIEGFLGLEYKLTGSTCGSAGQSGVKLEGSKRSIGTAKAVIEVPVVDIKLTEKPLFEANLLPIPNEKTTLADWCSCKPGTPGPGESPQLYCNQGPLTNP